MEFSEARDFTLPFGKFKGHTIDEVACTDDGLRYLDWLRGCEIRAHRFRTALDVYMDDPNVTGETVDALE